MSSVDTPPGTHVERETDPWAIDIADHPARTESETFRRAKNVAHRILSEVHGQVDTAGLLIPMSASGGKPVQAHHAGSLWAHDEHGWFLVLNICGVEWSAQWSAAPERIDALRVNAARFYAGFPGTLDDLARLGYPEGREILGEPITSAADVARWTDSLFNSCVMLSPGLHQGVVGPGRQAGGWHHYPKSIWDMQLTKRDRFTLWVTDQEGHPAAVADTGEGDGRVHVVWAHPGSDLRRRQREAHADGRLLTLDAGHPLAVQAFTGHAPAGGGEAA